MANSKAPPHGHESTDRPHDHGGVDTEPLDEWPDGNVISAKVDTSHIEVVFDSGRLRLHHLWLRDNCACLECRIAQTGERRYHLGSAPRRPRPISAAPEDGRCRIVWDDGHHTLVDAHMVAHVADRTRRSNPRPQRWDSNGIQRFPLGEVTSDHRVELQLLDTFQRAGAIVLTGVPTTSGTVADVLTQLGAPPRPNTFGLVHDVTVDPMGYNIAHTNEAVPPHNDFASYTDPPSGQALHMLANTTTGGESVLVDGFAALDELAELHPLAMTTLASVHVAFREWEADHESWCRAPLVRMGADGRPAALRYSNQLMEPLDPRNPSTDAFYEAYFSLSQLITAERHQRRFRLDSGEMILLDARRVLHARDSFDASSGRRHLQDAYFDTDDLAGRAAILRGQR